jgi:hypothetical protein
MGESNAAVCDQWPKKWWAEVLTCGRAVDQRCDLRLSCWWLSALVVVERPARPGGGPSGDRSSEPDHDRERVRPAVSEDARECLRHVGYVRGRCM